MHIIASSAIPQNQAPGLAAELAESWTLDQMGKGVIVYWPGFTVEDDDS